MPKYKIRWGNTEVLINGLDLNEPAFVGGAAIVAGEFGHGITGVGVLILHHSNAGLNFALDDIFGVGNAVFFNGNALV